MPDLRGLRRYRDRFLRVDPTSQYGVAAQGRSVVALVEELGLERPVLAGYDVGSRIAQGIARSRPELIDGIVVAPPLPGIGKRVFSEHAQAEFWYQAFHRLPVIEELDRRQARCGPVLSTAFLDALVRAGIRRRELDHLVERVLEAGSVHGVAQLVPGGRGSGGHVGGRDRRRRRTTGSTCRRSVLWPEFDPLFPRMWSDRLDDFFSDVRLRLVDGAGHYAPLEYPEILAEEIVGLG